MLLLATDCCSLERQRRVHRGPAAGAPGAGAPLFCFLCSSLFLRAGVAAVPGIGVPSSRSARPFPRWWRCPAGPERCSVCASRCRAGPVGPPPGRAGGADGWLLQLLPGLEVRRGPGGGVSQVEVAPLNMLSADPHKPATGLTLA